MKHKLKLATLTSLLCANAFADPVYLPPGSNLTYGASSNNQSIMSSITNPAAAAAELSRENGQYRFGILSSLGVGYEFGKVDDLYNKIDSTRTQLTAAQSIDITTYNTGAKVANYINTNIIAPVNSLTSELQKDGYASIFGDVHIPLTPLVVTKKGLGGSFVLEIGRAHV